MVKGTSGSYKGPEFCCSWHQPSSLWLPCNSSFKGYVTLLWALWVPAHKWHTELLLPLMKHSIYSFKSSLLNLLPCPYSWFSPILFNNCKSFLTMNVFSWKHSGNFLINGLKMYPCPFLAQSRHAQHDRL